MTERIELEDGFYLLEYEGKRFIGVNLDGKMFEFPIPENVYKSLRRREGRVYK